MFMYVYMQQTVSCVCMFQTHMNPFHCHDIVKLK